MPTDMGKGQPEAMERARKESLLGRLSDPAEVASFIFWLTETKGITGKVFDLDSRAYRPF
jgi:NAD(P)-dependent dehydrogenase (short-subunit alcohol dehydrogenase family)